MPLFDPQGAILRQDIGRLAGAIGERNLDHYAKLNEAATFIEQSLRQTGHVPMRQEYEARGMRFANVEIELRGVDRPHRDRHYRGTL
jgi:hypothetical protein